MQAPAKTQAFLASLNKTEKLSGNGMFRAVFTAILLISTPAIGFADNPKTWQHAAVAADHPAASAAGVEILKKGGNVVDAAVATAAALTVVRPESCGVGGGGFMVIWNAKTKKAVALDYRERAPKAATRGMYLKARRVVGLKPSQRGHLAVAVPGTIAGWVYANKHYGKLDLKTVLAPAIRLATKGVIVDRTMRKVQDDMVAGFMINPQRKENFAAIYKLYLNNGTLWKKGDRFHSPQGKLLERVANHGHAGFYKGEVADAIVAEMKRGGGIITKADLAKMQPVVRKSLRGTFDGRTILSMPPPSSGGVAILQMLNTISAYEKRIGKRITTKHNSPAYIHLVTEAMKHAFADRAEYLGDADFAKVPVDKLISAKYAATLARKIDPAKTFPPKYYGRFQPVTDGGTSHFSVIDAAGNAVACTETINLRFGSWVVEPKFGIVFNDEMDDFAAEPGKPNAFGLMQSEANAIQPGKKPLSSMSPTIVIGKDGKAILAVGASGGPRIISSTLQVMLNVLRFDKSVKDSIDSPRFHHQWLPDRIYLEDAIYKSRRDSLTKLGHKTTRRNGLAATQAVKRTKHGLTAASDPRKYGRPAGY